MKNIVFKLAFTILTFAVGVGFDRVVSLDRQPQIQNLEPITPKIVELQTESVVPAAAVPTPTPNLIFDYDPEKFSPDGIYYIMGRKPVAFADFEMFELGLAANLDGRISGYVEILVNSNDNSYFQSALFALVTERRVVFVTPPLSEDGFEYRFDGEFLRRNLASVAGQNKAVLRGTLTKTKQGRKIAERKVSFRVEHHGC